MKLQDIVARENLVFIGFKELTIMNNNLERSYAMWYVTNSQHDRNDHLIHFAAQPKASL
ncbi:MAG TPA: hypothetical protein VMW38_27800 [Terriglobia bacterium]|nr:hypothetical protein [Terriglobia bacterium]